MTQPAMGGGTFPECVLGVVLAGGQARRMGGGDKAMVELGGRPLLDHVLDRLGPQTPRIILNAAGDEGRFASYGLPVVADVIEGFAGPLAGVLTGLEWAAEYAPEITHVVSVPTDTPFFPADLVARMWSAMREQDAELACAASGGRSHPVFGLWPVALAADLRRAMVDEDMRKIDRWTARYDLATVVFDADGNGDGNEGGDDPFFNVNRPDDLSEAERRLT